jgi:hypothetical protein
MLPDIASTSALKNAKNASADPESMNFVGAYGIRPFWMPALTGMTAIRRPI